MFLQVVMSYADTENEALQAAYDQSRHSVLQRQELADLETPAAFDAASASLKPDVMRRAVRVSSSAQQHLEWLAKDSELGFERLYLHNIHPNQERFIAVFGEKVLPAFNQG
jgi:hypothetical protein